MSSSSEEETPGNSNAIQLSSSDTKDMIPRQKSLSEEVEHIKQCAGDLTQNHGRNYVGKVLLPQIDQWEKESIKQIELTAKAARDDLTRRSRKFTDYYTDLTTELSNQKDIDEANIERWTKLLTDCQDELQKILAIKINVAHTPLSLIIDKNAKEIEIETNENSSRNSRKLSTPLAIMASSEKDSYPSVSFLVTETNHPQIYELYKHLRSLTPMDKYGSMSGNCNFETTQMEQFLEETFDFQNLPNLYIVQGVKAFRLGKSLDSMSSHSVIRFPKKTISIAPNSFAMSVDEIRRWQSSYAVYADRNETRMTKEFLQRAFQGRSGYGAEAFLMKFVVRISQCPILMEFDGRVIHRDLDELWPNNIRLVSVTGIDFAGRMHDVDDIRTYVTNWRDIYQFDPKTNLPFVFNGRDFPVKPKAPRGKLDVPVLQHDLIRMARLRLRACDKEGVQIVVETGIGLGVFAGKYIGIDEEVRKHSAFAIRKVLEEDGPSYKHIRGIVFALPIFDRDVRNGRREDTYQTFVEIFHQTNYNGLIPVLIADQDMHRLTVAIARQGYIVSELNPADSHGVFGEYWQNRGPAVEEKLALTTVGLLVQHHLINPCVLDPSHYHLI